jgi:hypothetical protein
VPLHENSLAASTGFPYDELDAEPPAPGTEDHANALEFGRRLVSYIRSQDRARLTVDCLYLALGDAELEAETMSTVAAKNGVTKAAVSKRVKKIRRELHLPLTANNKSTHASQRYRISNASPLRLDGHSAARRVGGPPRPVSTARSKV